MTDQVFLLPDLGEGLTEAGILEWKVRVGDTVEIDQVVVEVETAKASVEVPIPFAGTVTTLHGEAGATLEVGTPLISVSSGEASHAESSGGSTVDAAHEQYRNEERAGSGNVLIGYGTSEHPRRRRRRPSTGSQPAPAAVNGPPLAVSDVQEDTGTPTRTVISPIVRNLARSRQVDLPTLVGSGAGGVITRADVERATAAATPSPRSTLAAADGDTITPLTGIRKAIADKLSTSRREIPDATTWVDVDATDLLRARAMINASLPESGKISLLGLLARLTTAALARYPELNSTVDTGRGQIVQFSHVNLGIAAQTPRGLVVPVIGGASTQSAVELTKAIQELTSLARDGKLPPARMAGGTFTLNNYGVFGVDGSTPIINHPEAAILGVGRIIDKPWVANGELAIRKVTQLSLSFDHRVCDGGTAAGFLRLFGDYIENPITVLGGF